MYWILQENLYNEEGFAQLTRALDVMELPYSIHKVVPFVGELQPAPAVPAGAKAIVMGAYTMCRIAKEQGWVPGRFVSDDLDYTRQIPHWGDRLLNADAWTGRLGDVPVQPKPFFIRPTFDSKVFAGTVMDWPEFEEWKERLMPLEGATVDMDTQVMVCPRKVIYGEYRTWVVDGRIVTASQYKQGTTVLYNADVPDGILQFAQECVDIWSPLPAFVLDVASTPDGLRIVETNCINAAGFYAGNVGKLVQALEDLAGEQS